MRKQCENQGKGRGEKEKNVNKMSTETSSVRETGQNVYR